MPSDSARDDGFDGRPESSPADRQELEFGSVLFERRAPELGGGREADFFSDLNLDQVIASIVSGNDEYDLVLGTSGVF